MTPVVIISIVVHMLHWWPLKNDSYLPYYETKAQKPFFFNEALSPRESVCVCVRACWTRSSSLQMLPDVVCSTAAAAESTDLCLLKRGCAPLSQTQNIIQMWRMIFLCKCTMCVNIDQWWCLWACCSLLTTGVLNSVQYVGQLHSVPVLLYYFLCVPVHPHFYPEFINRQWNLMKPAQIPISD